MIDLIHPTGNQFVRHLLDALDQTGLLRKFHTTLAFQPDSFATRFLPAGIRSESARRTYRLPKGKMETRPARELTRLFAQRLKIKSLLQHETGWACVDRVYQDLDQAVAQRLKRFSGQSKIKGVYGYEDGCVETFREARRQKLATYYDLPIAYWKTSRQLLEEEAQRLPEWEPTLVGTRDSQEKFERKTEEISLADVVICPSLFVYRSLPEEIRQSKRCLVAEFGSPEPGKNGIPRTPSAERKLRVLFAGSMSQRKGLADVFAAMRLLKRSDIELIVMGSPLVEMAFYKRAYPDFIYEPTRPHTEVLKLMNNCDVLVLPSIVEGRALVQQEAMASGLPLIVTANAGGEDLVIEGKTGFLVPIRDPEVIAEKLSWLADHPEHLADMQNSAKEKAAEYPWSRYCKLILDAIAANDGGNEMNRLP